jgi:hypothetical protein
MPTFNLCLTREQILHSHQVISVDAESREKAEALLNDAIIDCDGHTPQEKTGDAFSVEIAGQHILIRKPAELVADDWKLN